MREKRVALWVFSAYTYHVRSEVDQQHSLRLIQITNKICWHKFFLKIGSGCLVFDLVYFMLYLNIWHLNSLVRNSSPLIWYLVKGQNFNNLGCYVHICFPYLLFPI